MTGDTVLHQPVLRLPDTLRVDVMLLHLGAVPFPLTGPLRYSMNGTVPVGSSTCSDRAWPSPVHYEGWSHVSESVEHLRTRPWSVKPPIREVITWLPPGRPVDV